MGTQVATLWKKRILVVPVITKMETELARTRMTIRAKFLPDNQIDHLLHRERKSPTKFSRPIIETKREKRTGRKETSQQIGIFQEIKLEILPNLQETIHKDHREPLVDK